MAEQQRQHQPGPGPQVGDDGRQIEEAHAGAEIEPDQIRKQHGGHGDAGDPDADMLDLRAAERRRQRVDQQQRNQDQPGIGGQQQQTGLDAEHQPGAPASLPRAGPVVQQDQRPQRRRKDGGAELRRRHREHRDAGHQHHRHHRVRRADDGAAEREHRPQRDDDADLRQQIDAGHAERPIGDLGEPERQRRPELGAELELVADRQHQRQLPGRRGVEQRRHQRPQHRLQHGHGPEQQARARAQQLDEQGHRNHRAANIRTNGAAAGEPAPPANGAAPKMDRGYGSSGSTVSVTSITVSP